MSVIWSGVTEEGAVVPVQVTDGGKVVITDVAPGGDYLQLTGGNLTGDLTVNQQITLATDGTSTFAADATINLVTVGRGSGSVADNTVLGRLSLSSNLTGNENTALGRETLNQNTVGRENTAVGYKALITNTEGNANTAVGNNSLAANQRGNYNVAVGMSTMPGVTTGSSNIQIGGVTSIGQISPVFNLTTQSNRIVMGSNAVTNAYVQVAWTVTSDARDKTNFAPVPHGLDFVKQLNPTAYQFKLNRAAEETNGGVRYGFAAQDILALEGDNPVIIDNEDPDHLKYRGEALIPVLVNAIKEQQVLIDALAAKIDSMGSDNA